MLSRTYGSHDTSVTLHFLYIAAAPAYLSFALAVMNWFELQFHAQSSLPRLHGLIEDCNSMWRHAQWLTRQAALLLALVRALVHADGNISNLNLECHHP